jgi:hypothetical protein
VVADSHHFDDEQDPNPDPHLSEKLYPDPQPWLVHEGRFFLEKNRQMTNNYVNVSAIIHMGRK